MASLVLTGDTSGQVTIASPAVAGTNTLTLQAATATNAVNTLATAVASTSGTSIDFTSLPSWIKKITVMFNGVSTSGTSIVQVQIGSGSVATSGYLSQGASFNTNSVTCGSQSTTGFMLETHNPYFTAAGARSGHMLLTNLSGNLWVSSSIISATITGSPSAAIQSGTLTLSGVLDRVRITTVNGTDTFDAGSINILYEG